MHPPPEPARRRPVEAGLKAPAAAAMGLSALLALAGCEPAAYVEKGDLPALRSRGKLRILMPPLDPPAMPRRGYAISHEREMARNLAKKLDLDPVFVTIEARDALLENLLAGRGDLVLARLTITEERGARVAFSAPVDRVREVLVVRAGEGSIRSLPDLAGRRVGVRPSSSFHQTLAALKGSDVPGMEIVPMDEHLDIEQILEEVAHGHLDATVVDDDQLDQILTWRSDVEPAFDLTGPRPVAWAMRPGSVQLKSEVDRFLKEEALLGDPVKVSLEDLDGIRKRKVLRVLTRNNAATTFLHRGKQVGFEYELVREFAKSLGVRVQLVIPPGFGDLVPWLRKGKGDLIAASLVITQGRRKRVAFTRPYLVADQVVVLKTERAPGIGSLADLAGTAFAVRRSSPYRQTLEFLRHARGLPLRVQEVDERLETEDLIDGVAEGTWEATVALSHILDISRSWRQDIAGALPLGDPLEVAWAVRPENVKLLGAADRFLASHGRGSAFLNILREKYFHDSDRVSRRVRGRPEITGRISRYDPIFRRYGKEAGIDWRLLASMAYQESGFDPSARSWAGAVGLMQLLPRTAREIGIHGDLHDPELSVRAGARYLRRLIETYYGDLEEDERVRFALGAYNAGPGHIRDAMRLAREMGLDDGTWHGHVAEVLPLLSRSTYASQAAHGYCRCRQTVEYVRMIEERHRRYLSVVPSRSPSAPAVAPPPAPRVAGRPGMGGRAPSM